MKLKLETLKLNSFVTTLDSQKRLRGGVGGTDIIPIVTAPGGESGMYICQTVANCSEMCSAFCTQHQTCNNTQNC